MRLAITLLRTKSLLNLRDLVRKMWINVQFVSYLLVAMKNCGMVSAAQFFTDFGQRAVISCAQKIDGYVSGQSGFLVSLFAS